MDLQSEKLLSQLIRGARIAGLATLSDEAPLVSMVAFVAADDFSLFYIHVSKLAQHTVDMMKDKRVGLLIVETDDGRVNPQTLARVSIRASAEIMQNGEPGYTPIKNKYIERFPESAPLFNLEDFGVWRIKPKGGRFVAGLGKAYNITPETLQKVSQLETSNGLDTQLPD
jgi:putative heme iron utilization protein